MKESTDFELIDLCREGDENAFREIVERYESLIATITFNMMGESNDAVEIGQQVFIQLYRSIHKFRKEASLKTYLSRIAMNRCINELKRKQRVNQRHGELTTAYHIGVEPSQQFEHRDIIHQGLMKLDQKYRSVVVLRMIEEFDTLETSAALGIPKGTVLSRLKRGLEKLKHILENELNYYHE